MTTRRARRCFATGEDANDVFGRMHPLPVTAQQEKATIKAYKDYGRFATGSPAR